MTTFLAPLVPGTGIESCGTLVASWMPYDVTRRDFWSDAGTVMSLRIWLALAWCATPPIRYEPATVGPSGQIPDASPSALISFAVHSSNSFGFAGVVPIILPTKYWAPPPLMPSRLPTLVVRSPIVLDELICPDRK